MEPRDTENRYPRGLEVWRLGQEGTKSGRLVTQCEVWYKVLSNGLEDAWVLNIPKIQCSLKCNHKAGQIQSDTREPWA